MLKMLGSWPVSRMMVSCMACCLPFGPRPVGSKFCFFPGAFAKKAEPNLWKKGWVPAALGKRVDPLGKGRCPKGEPGILPSRQSTLASS